MRKLVCPDCLGGGFVAVLQDDDTIRLLCAVCMLAPSQDRRASGAPVRGLHIDLWEQRETPRDAIWAPLDIESTPETGPYLLALAGGLS